MASMISFSASGETYQAYFSPSASGSGPGVILLQEYWGLVGHIKNVADRLALEGFTVLAPDLFQGKVHSDPDDALSALMALNIDQFAKVLQSGITTLLDQAQTTGDRVGAMGFCMGGQLSLYAGTIDERIAAVVDYYGIHPIVKPDFTKLTAPVLGIFASEDEYNPVESIQALDDELSRLGKPHEFVMYQDRQHAFFNNDRPEVYDFEAAEDSFQRVLDFLRGELGA